MSLLVKFHGLKVHMSKSKIRGTQRNDIDPSSSELHSYSSDVIFKSSSTCREMNNVQNN